MTPSAPIDVESRINKQLGKVYSFKNSVQNIMMMMMKYYVWKKYIGKIHQIQANK